ncbi:hypothetical protein J6590_029844 [Homalodisca vitripennis]|nr:hypothetical protein J6590_029844 [Homalodisca vitripennis]
MAGNEPRQCFPFRPIYDVRLKKKVRAVQSIDERGLNPETLEHLLRNAPGPYPFGTRSHKFPLNLQ